MCTNPDESPCQDLKQNGSREFGMAKVHDVHRGHCSESHATDKLSLLFPMVEDHTIVTITNELISEPWRKSMP